MHADNVRRSHYQTHVSVQQQAFLSVLFRIPPFLFHVVLLLQSFLRSLLISSKRYFINCYYSFRILLNRCPPTLFRKPVPPLLVFPNVIKTLVYSKAFHYFIIWSFIVPTISSASLELSFSIITLSSSSLPIIFSFLL